MGVFLQIISVCATLAALCMMASPVVTVQRMRAAKSVGSMTITFFCAQFLNCNVWSMYGVQMLALPVIMCNTFGSAVSAYCILTFLTVARMEEKAGHVLKSTSYVASLKMATLTMFLITMLLVLFLYLMSFSSSDFSAQLNGILSGCCSVLMLSSPLVMAKAIIREKNAEPLQPATVMFATLNSVLWTLYGLLSLDMYITIPNVLCTLACIFQIFLLVRYGRHPAEHIEITATIAPVPLD
ncbi:conserved hypothetical protein [Leishmania mexicana MHOM/GT/2001/U1103]|uniref:Sugar efflux transporter n=1 Tax=Leishmania mexicana (strain MHOM/GT/2001/U1103) TaxID=929439 RepID=E9ATS1_LEIMU|nr:conserved hypothetical protein [Leishmania mexicana MHOM/GT/2001/U1103]CBZ26346.1 conserved hypothetical protein [Leishmania mexicana MHOM/GT/2001/U1103]